MRSSRQEEPHPKGYELAHNLREEPKPAERKLWAYLRGNNLNEVNFRRQHARGSFVPDCCAIKGKLVIELDGSHHLEQEKYDEDRTKRLESQGYKVIRSWNDQVMNDLEGVIKTLTYALDLNDKHGSSR